MRSGGRGLELFSLGKRELFADADLNIEDLYLLESFQIEYLPDCIPERELALVLWAHPSIHRFLRIKCPEVSRFLDAAKERYPPSTDRSDLEKAEDVVVWTIADLIVYNKCPDVYDGLEFHGWDFAEVTGLTPLDGKVVVDVGSGTGRVALEAAAEADTVFAVEPVGRLRRFLREKATSRGCGNVHVIDGFGHSIPLPDGFADVVITSHSIGWNLERELAEIERIASSGGHIIHCPGMIESSKNRREEERHERLTSLEWGYEWGRYRDADGWKRKYWKRLP